MSSAPAAGLTELLQSWQGGAGAAFSELFSLAYAELKQIAAQRLRQSGPQLTLTPTVLLHEAYLRVAEAPVDFKNRAHFFASMSLYIRSALVDHARARQADKRGGGAVQVSLSEALQGDESMVADILALDQILAQLAALDRRCADVLHLNCFAGLDRQQIADVLHLSLATVDRDLRFARAWVRDELERGR